MEDIGDDFFDCLIQPNSTGTDVTAIPIECGCEEGPTWIISKWDGNKTCKECGTVVIGTDLSAKSGSFSKDEILPYDITLTNGSIGGTKTSNCSFNRKMQMHSSKDNKPLLDKINDIRRSCQGEIHKSIVDAGINLFRIIDEDKRLNGGIRRGRPLCGYKAACIKRAAQQAKFPLDDKKLALMFFPKRNDDESDDHRKSISLYHVNKGMEKLHELLGDIEERTHDIPLSTAEKRLQEVISFIKTGIDVLDMPHDLLEHVVKAAKRINTSVFIKNKQHKTIYVSLIVLLNLRYPSSGLTTEVILERLPVTVTVSTVNAFRKGLMLDWKRKFKSTKTPSDQDILKYLFPEG